MITEPEAFHLPTVSADKIELMANWREGIDGKFVRMRVNGGKWITVERHALVRLAMLVGNDEEQESLIPMQQLEVMHLKKKYSVKITKHLKPGDVITIPINLDIPLTKETTSIPVIGKGLHLT